jgi:hypothetical protein
MILSFLWIVFVFFWFKIVVFKCITTVLLFFCLFSFTPRNISLLSDFAVFLLCIIFFQLIVKHFCYSIIPLIFLLLIIPYFIVHLIILISHTFLLQYQIPFPSSPSLYTSPHRSLLLPLHHIFFFYQLLDLSLFYFVRESFFYVTYYVLHVDSPFF